METRSESIRRSRPKLPPIVVEKIVNAEKEILNEAVKQNRTFPYKLTLEDSGGELASETIETSDVRKAIIAGQVVDDLGWKWTSHSEFEISTKDLTMSLKSGIEPLTRTFRIAEP